MAVLLKASFPTLVILSDIETFLRLVQYEKATLSIISTDSGISMLVSELADENAE